MHAYSLDLRLRIVAAVDAGKTPSEVATQFAFGVATVKRYRQQRRETDSHAGTEKDGAKRDAHCLTQTVPGAYAASPHVQTLLSQEKHLHPMVLRIGDVDGASRIDS